MNYTNSFFWFITGFSFIYVSLDLMNISIHMKIISFLMILLMNMISYSTIFILICHCLYIIINDLHQQNDLLSMIKSSIDKFFIQVKMYTCEQKKKPQKLKDLPRFLPFTCYQTFHIDEMTLPLTILELIQEAETTNKFTMYCLNGNMENYLHIEFIQESKSLLLIIKISHLYPHRLLEKINELFLVILNPKNCITIWGSISDILLISDKYHLFYYDSYHPIPYTDLQPHFKCWYNQNFVHNDYCNQILDYNFNDGPLCSCPHRPLKSLVEKWNLDMAIGYTFQEYLDMDTNNGLNQCLAITTLSIIIEEQWTYEKVQKYIHDQRIRRKVIISYFLSINLSLSRFVFVLVQ